MAKRILLIHRRSCKPGRGEFGRSWVEAIAHRYPANVRTRINVAAVGDYVSHDRSVRDDYRAMLELGLIESIDDQRIYDFAVRHGRSNPRHGPGYRVHPKVIAAIADWGSAETESARGAWFRVNRPCRAPRRRDTPTFR